MRNELLIGGNLARSQNHAVKIGRGHLNGLVVLVDRMTAEDRITIQRRTPRKTEVLLQNVPLFQLAAVSSVEIGYDSKAYEPIKDLAALIVTKGTFSAAEFNSNVREPNALSDRVAFYIQLGSLYLGQDSELDISLTLGAGGSGGTEPLYIYRFSGAKLPDFMVQLDVVSDFDAHHPNVDKVFLVSKTMDDALMSHTVARSIDVKVEDHEGPYLTDVRGLYLCTNLFETVEAMSRADIFEVYQRPDELPAQVHIKVSGADAALAQLLVRKLVFDRSLIAHHNLRNTELLSARLKALETAQPEVAAAMRESNLIPASGSVDRAISETLASYRYR